MKITSFNPLIVSKNADNIIKLFEEIGFEKKHTKEGITENNIVSVDMKYDDKFRVNVASSDRLPQDLTIIRMNVDNFDEVYEMLTAKGFTVAGGQVVDTGSSKSAMMVSPSGFAFDLVQHIKK